MKILHLADLHLGKNVVGLPMIEDQRFVLNQALDLCKSEGIRNIIISGDIYDRSLPSEEAVKLLNDFLSKTILEDKIKVYIISGNHDSKERLSCFSDLLERAGLFIDSHINKDLILDKHVIEEDDVKVNLYSLPYTFPSEIRLLTNDANIKDWESATKKVLDANQVNNDEINFINAHCFVGGEGIDLKTSESESRPIVGTIEIVPYNLFDKFDYVALGHLHNSQHVGRENIRYAGSPLKYSEDEIAQHKCFTVINVKNKKDIAVEKHEIHPLHEFVCLEGKLEDFIINPEIKDERIVCFRLTNTEPVLNAAAKLKTKFPNYVGLKYINIKTDVSDNETVNKVEGFENLTPMEQFEKFFNFIHEKELSQLQKDTFEEVVDELEGE